MEEMMPIQTRLLVVGCMVLATLFACQAPEEPDATQSTSQAVIDGTREPTYVTMTPGQQLGVIYLTSSGRPGSYWCSGTLVAPTIVTTAKHCTEGNSNMAVAFGRDPAGNDPIIDVARVFEHPSVDVSILLLSQDATQVVPGVEVTPINRASLSGGNVGNRVEVGGYGETRQQGRSGRWFGALEIVEVSSTAINIYGQGRRGFCFGDSGGPLFLRDGNGQTVTAAVISATQDQSCLGWGFTERLDVLASWIDEIEAGGNPDGGCNGLDFLGRCDGEVAQWCEQNIVRSRDCGDKGVGCSFIDNQVGYICDCTGLPNGGRCHGDAIQRCDGNRLREEDCSERGLTCGLVQGAPTCTNDPQPAPDPEDDPAPNPDGDPAPDPDGDPAPDPGGDDPAPDPGGDDPDPGDDPAPDPGGDDPDPDGDEPGQDPAPDPGGDNPGPAPGGEPDDGWAESDEEFGDLSDEDQAWLNRGNPQPEAGGCSAAGSSGSWSWLRRR
jgi:hypothetical protein